MSSKTRLYTALGVTVILAGSVPILVYNSSKLAFGDVATWLASIATVLALSLALWQGVHQRQSELNRQVRADRLERRQIAVLVRPTDWRLPGQPWATVNFLNSSDSLVVNIRCEIQFTPPDPNDESDPVSRLWVLQPAP